MRKLSRTWHGTYRVCSTQGRDVTVTRLYFSGQPIQVHLKRVMRYPPHLPAGFYWYGQKLKYSDQPPKWVEDLLSRDRQVSNDRKVADQPERQEKEANVAAVSISVDKDAGDMFPLSKRRQR